MPSLRHRVRQHQIRESIDHLRALAALIDADELTEFEIHSRINFICADLEEIAEALAEEVRHG